MVNTMTRLYLSNDDFDGNLDIWRMTLFVLSFSENSVVGNLEYLWLFNHLHTSNLISFTSLPDTIISLVSVDGMHISGGIRFKNGTSNVEYLFLDYSIDCTANGTNS